MKKQFSKLLLMDIAIIFCGILLDQLTKWLATTYLRPLQSVPLLREVLHLTYVENTGIAFGLLQDRRALFMTVSALTIVVLAFYLFSLKEKSDTLPAVAVSMILAGGIGNMIDRLYLGYVVDFIDFTLIDFAVFNTADSLVCIGAALLFLAFLIEWRKEEKRKKQHSTPTGHDEKPN